MAKVSKEPLRILMVGFTDSLPGARHAEFYTDEHFLARIIHGDAQVWMSRGSSAGLTGNF